MCTAVCSRHSVRGLIAVIASVTPVCLKDTKFPRQQRPVAFWESDPQDSLFLPVPSWVFLLRLPPHIQEAITKARQTMAHPNKDLGMPWPLDNLLPSSLCRRSDRRNDLWPHLHADFVKWFDHAVNTHRWICFFTMTFMRSDELWLLASVHRRHLPPVTVMSLQYNCS